MKKKMTHILAVLRKTIKVSNSICWQAWLLDTPIQSEVEQFMCEIRQSDYFLVDPADLKKNDVGNYILERKDVLTIKVKVTRNRRHDRKFLICG